MNLAEYDTITEYYDIPDLDSTLGSLRRVLSPRAWFAFSITHPCFEAPHARWIETDDGQPARQISEYFEEMQWYPSNPHGLRARVVTTIGRLEAISTIS